MRTSGIFLRAYGMVAMLLQLYTCYSSPVAKGKPICKEVAVPISLSAQNIYMAPDTTMQQALDLVTNAISYLIGFIFDELVQGTYTITGRYCEPEVVIPSRSNTLQFLMHGATYNRNYWSGDGYPGYGYGGEKYSWVSYASQQGYPTFAIDRLGSGDSSHPDPILVVQVPTQTEIAHQIITLARHGTSPFPRNFTKVVVVGHSLGSIITQSLSVGHPADADAMILTGYSKYIINFVPGLFVTGVLLPAAFVLPQKYGHLPAGYLTVDSYSGFEYLFYYGSNGSSSDPAFIAYDYSLRASFTVGEGATGAFAAATASRYTGSVLTITGQQDTLFCGTTALEIDGPGQCVGGPLNYLAQTGTLYPVAQNYQYYAVPNAGHCWQYHYSAQEGFQFVHSWLASRGF